MSEIRNHIKNTGLTTDDVDDVIVVVVVIVDLDDLRGQRPSTNPFILRAALSVNKTVLLVDGLHQSLTLQHRPEEGWNETISMRDTNTETD